MKKLFIFVAAAMGLGLVSCDQVDLPNPPAQSNPQEALFNKGDLEVVADPAAATTVYDLTDYQDLGNLVPLADVTKMENIPSGYELRFGARLSTGTDFDKSEIACQVVDGKVMAEPDVLNGAIREITKNIAEVDVNVKLYPYIVSTVNPTFSAKVEAEYGPFAIKLKPFAPATVIEQNYYLLLSADAFNWTLDGAVKSIHSSNNVYDDPEFRFQFTVTDDQIMRGGMYWKILPESVYTSSNWATGVWYGTTADDLIATEGKLTHLNPEAGLDINVSGPIEMVINLDKGTFKYVQAIPFFYTPGGSNGWSAPASQQVWTSDYINYAGFVSVDGGFKFNPDTDWKGRDFGVSTPLTFDGDPLTGTGVADGSNNIDAPVKGVYWVTLNYTDYSVKMVLVNTIGLIGDATANGWNGDTALTPSADFLVWTGTVTMGEGEFKVRVNNDWAINFGGNASDLQFDKGNMPSPGAGTYDVTLNLGVYPYAVTFVKK